MPLVSTVMETSGRAFVSVIVTPGVGTFIIALPEICVVRIGAEVVMLSPVEVFIANATMLFSPVAARIDTFHVT